MDVLKELVEGCKEEKMTAEEMLKFLPTAIIAAGQSDPSSGLLSKPLDEILREAEKLFNA